MLGEEKNLTDLQKSLNISIKDNLTPISYSKTNKLIIALYIVTDIIDEHEPIRLQLRTLGLQILSDIESGSRSNTGAKIQTTLSFLDIGRAINLISEMNFNILRKEFMELKLSLKEFLDSKHPKPTWLAEFLQTPHPLAPAEARALSLRRGRINPIGHTRIGVQKGSTLMQALSDRTSMMSDSKIDPIRLKKDRRDELIKIIKDNNSSATITDIRINTKGLLASFSEKTLQRELVSMVREGILTKSGEKRWSRYSLKD